MSQSLRVLALCALVTTTTLARAGEFPAWAYPVNPPGASPVVDDGSLIHVPDSNVALTRTQISAVGGPLADWHPEEHPTIPGIVARASVPGGYACGYCHLPSGAGRPENTSLAGLSATYLKQQVLAFRQGNRTGSEPKRGPLTAMIGLTKTLTDAELDEAATYFAALKPASFIKVIETDTVPKTIVAGWTFARAPERGTEPLGDRILEMPEDFERFEHRDSHTPYIAYVPVGSLKRGEELVTTGGHGRTLQCTACHGPQLRGVVDVPRLAGRSPSYLMRQLYDLKQGNRTGGTSVLMKPVVANLNDADMLAIVAYLASLAP